MYAFKDVKKKVRVYVYLSLFCLLIPMNLQAEGLNLGIIDDSPRETTKAFTPLLKYLNNKGVATGRVITIRDIDALARKLNDGKVDFVFDSPYATLRMMDETGAIPLLVHEKRGVKEYNSVIFVPAASPIQQISDLKGKVIAFEDPTSTSSFMLPVNILKNAGLIVTESRKAVDGAVAYYFSKDDDNTLVQVKAGKRAQAGGIKKSEVYGNADFRILEPASPMVPRSIVFIRKGVDGEALRAALLGMRDDPSAKDALKAMKAPTGFSEADGDLANIMNGHVREAMGL